MPYLSKERRWQGAHTPTRAAPHAGGVCDCDWTDPANWNAHTLAHRVLPTPDQSRYGTATTDPLGRDGPGWHTGQHGLPVKSKGDHDATD